MQVGSGMAIDDLLLQVLSWEKAATSKLGKMLIKDTIDYTPMACKKRKTKITNKTSKAILDTGIGDYVVNTGNDLIGEEFN